MPAAKTLQEYQDSLGELIIGVSHEIFNTTDSNHYLRVKCKCGEIFATKKQDLMARFNRGNNIQCVSCVASKNVSKRYETKVTPEP